MRFGHLLFRLIDARLLLLDLGVEIGNARSAASGSSLTARARPGGRATTALAEK
jgi:hypothetical protein